MRPRRPSKLPPEIELRPGKPGSVLVYLCSRLVGAVVCDTWVSPQTFGGGRRVRNRTRREPWPKPYRHANSPGRKLGFTVWRPVAQDPEAERSLPSERDKVSAVWAVLFAMAKADDTRSKDGGELFGLPNGARYSAWWSHQTVCCGCYLRRLGQLPARDAADLSFSRSRRLRWQASLPASRIRKYESVI